MNAFARIKQPEFAQEFGREEVCKIDGRCRCPTCGVVEAVLHGTLVARGFSRVEAERVTVGPGGLGGGNDYLASVRVDGREVYRIERNPDEALDPAVIDDIERALGGW